MSEIGDRRPSSIPAVFNHRDCKNVDGRPKRAYETLSEAADAARSLHFKDGRTTHAYRCHACWRYHVGGGRGRKGRKA